MKSKEMLEKEIMAIKDWRHPFEVCVGGGGVCSKEDPFGRTWMHQWQKFRRDIQFEMLTRIVPLLTGHGLDTLTVLDVGCNDGYFGFEAHKCGVKSVCGIDLREDAIKRANLIKEYFDFKNIEFRQDNVEQSTLLNNRFDIVLLYGLLYHLSNPIDFLSKISEITRHVVIVATFITGDTNPSLRLIYENSNLPGSGAQALVTRPSQKAVVEMLAFAGFNEIARYYPYPFFDFGSSDNAGITPASWAFYIASKSDSEHNFRNCVDEIEFEYSASKKKPQLVLLKSFGQDYENFSRHYYGGKRLVQLAKCGVRLVRRISKGR